MNVYQKWIGVDLDGTLAHYEGYIPNFIGPPIPHMLEKVKTWCKEGKRVKIFTARAEDPFEIPLVLEWLRIHGLPNLEVTNIKDSLMEAIYDDRAFRVVLNTGRTCCEHNCFEQEIP